MTRRLKATTPGHRNPTLTEEQLAGELERWQATQRSAAIAVCGNAIKAGCNGIECGFGHARHLAEIIQDLRMVIDRDTLARWGMEPDPVPSAKGKYAWGSAKGAKAG